ncbi:hypothetical protein HMPREF1557_01013 [Streptococcus sobrinus W1703]|uniref:Uncharacterized protein n=1 Tax=Streptococcus sobrinus W1703 TaxID=1227275 RepID=U2KGM7_9STRE|nr:hypothetical protein HMPREF1557_01013 [Streptococcus sobrinus W1703]
MHQSDIRLIAGSLWGFKISRDNSIVAISCYVRKYQIDSLDFNSV